MIVLSVNRDELCHSVEAIYGPTFNTDRYLRRFVDLSIGLPVPDEEDLSSFLAMMLETSGLDSRFRADGYERPMLEMVADLPVAVCATCNKQCILLLWPWRQLNHRQGSRSTLQR